MFKDHTGRSWDLSDPKTFKRSWFPDKYIDMSPLELHREIEHHFGQALFYMDMWMPFRHEHPWPEDDGGQRKRIMELAKSYLQNFADNADDAMWLKAQLFILLDETENMC